MIGGSICMYSSRSLQICPLINLGGMSEYMSAGAPFPHCGAAHGASGGPRLPPETTYLEDHTAHRQRGATPGRGAAAKDQPRSTTTWGGAPRGGAGRRGHMPPHRAQ